MCDVMFTLQMYKRHDPSTVEEIEFMENLFNSLCSALMLPANRDRFLRGEGIQLMNLMLRFADLCHVNVFIGDAPIRHLPIIGT